MSGPYMVGTSHFRLRNLKRDFFPSKILLGTRTELYFFTWLRPGNPSGLVNSTGRNQNSIGTWSNTPELAGTELKIHRNQDFQ